MLPAAAVADDVSEEDDDIAVLVTRVVEGGVCRTVFSPNVFILKDQSYVKKEQNFKERFVSSFEHSTQLCFLLCGAELPFSAIHET